MEYKHVKNLTENTEPHLALLQPISIACHGPFSLRITPPSMAEQRASSSKSSMVHKKIIKKKKIKEPHHLFRFLFQNLISF